MKTHYTLIALSTALALSSISYGQDFNKTVFFGDSLTDSGSYINLGKNSDGTINSFTTNPDPVWAEVLADSYNTSAISTADNEHQGTNYAEGGAKTEEVVWISFFSSISPTKNQIKSYLDTHEQKADPKALYSIWIGANDLMGISTSDPLAAGLEIKKRAGYTAAQFEQLHQAGAKYILAPNIPNVGLAPEYVKNEKKKALATQGADFYNKTLFRDLSTTEVNVIPVDTFTLLTEVVNSPTEFGFNKDKVQERICPKNWLIPDSLTCVQDDDGKINNENPEEYIFADSIHPTGHTHRILAQYARSIIEAPETIGMIPQIVLQGTIQDTQKTNLRLNQLPKNQNTWWIEATGLDNQLSAAETSSISPTVTVGGGIGGNNTNTGLYAKYNQQQHELGSKNVNSEITQYGIGVYHRYQPNNFRLNIHGGINRLNVDTERRIDWEGPARYHKAEANGTNVYASVQGSYIINNNRVSYQPYLGLNAQHVKVNHLAESSVEATAMSFNKQTQDSIRGELGINMAYQASATTQMVAGIGYTHEFKDDEHFVTASLNSMSGYSKGFSLPVNNKLDKNSTRAHLGFNTKLNQNIKLNAGVSTNYSDNEQKDLAGYIGLEGSF